MKVKKLHADTIGIAFLGKMIHTPCMAVILEESIDDSFLTHEPSLLFGNTVNNYYTFDPEKPLLLSGVHRRNILAVVSERTYKDHLKVFESILCGGKTCDHQLWIVSDSLSVDQEGER